MARKITVTKAELEHLREVVKAATSLAAVKLSTLLRKAEAAHSALANEPEPGESLAELEAAFLRGAGKKGAGAVWTGDAGRFIARARQLRATADEFNLIGRWLARQHWATGTFSVVTVLNKWADWLGRARAELARPTPSGHGPAPLSRTWDDWEERNTDVEGLPDAPDAHAPGPPGPAQGNR